MASSASATGPASSAPSMAATSTTTAKTKQNTGTPVHLVVLCHGLWGEPIHLHTLQTLLQRSFGDRASVVRPAKPSSDKKQQHSANDEGSTSSSSSSIKSNSSGTHKDGEEKLSEQHEKLLRSHASDVRKDADMDLVILNTRTNSGGKTYDGIDWLAERVVNEIKEEQRSLKAQPHGGRYIARISFIGYSLGGLVARCAIGVLESQDFFRGIQARSVITIATPHIGSPQGSGAFGKLVSYVGSRLLSRTGEQLYAIDSGWGEAAEKDPSGKRRSIGLLECMSLADSVFIKGLRRFEKVNFYANAVNDITVPFRTGCIESWDPFVERAGFVDVKVLSNAPIISNIHVTEPPKKTLTQAVISSIPTSVPLFFNPSKLPFGFPWNYVVVIGSPVLIPIFTARVLLRLSKDSKRSRVRIADLERGWEIEQEGRVDSRIDRLVKNMMLEQDSNVNEVELVEGSEETSSASSETSSLHQVESTAKEAQEYVEIDTASTKPPKRAPWFSATSSTSDRKHLGLRQNVLLPSQENIVRNLNDVKTLPNLTKIWAYFPEVTNAHAIIIARTLSIEPHKHGLPIIKYIVDDFLC